MAEGSVVIVGGTAGIGYEIARRYAKLGRPVVITGRDLERSVAAANRVGGSTTGLAFDLAAPATIVGAVADVGPVDHLVLTAIERDENHVRDYDVARALRLTTLKLVGYLEVIHVLAGRLGDDGSVLIFGGRAKDRPYPGSTTVTTVNGGVSAMVRTLAVELAPIRVNALHPGIVGDSPYWSGKTQALEAVKARTPGGRLVTMHDVVDATAFLLANRSVNGVNLYVDGGWLLT
ncbi:MAG: SDR family oxidoreductase [Acidimicrobiales bacterium]